MCRTMPRIFYSATGWGKGSSVQGGHRISRGRQPRRKGPTTRAEAPFSRKPSAVHFKPRQRPAHRPSPPRVGVGPGFYWPVWRTTAFPIVRCRGGALEWGGCVGRQSGCAGAVSARSVGSSPTNYNSFFFFHPSFFFRAWGMTGEGPCERQVPHDLEVDAGGGHGVNDISDLAPLHAEDVDN